MSGMLRRVVSGLKWSAISQTSRLVTQLAGMFILARLLPPSDFGLVAMAGVATGFANLFRDFGTSAAIIQKQESRPELLDSIFWLHVLISVGTAALFCLLAPAIALAFAEPRLKEVLWMFAASFPIVGLGIVHQALLEKATRFRQLAMIEIFAALSGLGAATWAAWAGWGVFSLVLQIMVSACLTTGGLWIFSRWRPLVRYSAREIHGVLGFGGNLVGFNVLNYFIRNADNLLIGRVLGAADLGIYSMAYRLMFWPLQNICGTVGRVLFPAFSQMQGDKIRIREAYIRVTSAIVLLTAPLMFGFFVLREPFVKVAMGEQWIPVIDILAWLVPVGLLQSISTSVGSLYLAMGRTDMMFRWSVGAGIVTIPAFFAGVQFGITGVAIAYFLVSLLLFWPSMAIPFRLTGLRVGDVIRKIMKTIISAAIMALVVAILDHVWPSSPYGQWLRLSILVLAGILIYCALVFLIQRTLVKDIIRLAAKR